MKVNLSRITSNKKHIIFVLVYLIITFAVAFLIKKQDYNDYSFELNFEEMKFEYTEAGLKSGYFTFPAATHVINLTYSSTVDTEMVVIGDNNELTRFVFPKAENGNVASTLPYVLNEDVNAYYLFFPGATEDTISISNVNLLSTEWFNNDGIMKAIIFSLLSIIVLFFILGIKSELIKNESIIPCVVLFIFTLYVCNPCFFDYLQGGHDIWCHLGRIEGLKEAIKDGQLIAMVIPNSFNGYGVLGFVYPELFLYLPAVLRLLAVSMPLAYHVFIAFVNVLTALVCYFSVRSLLKDFDRTENNVTKINIISTVTTLAYLMMSYRLEDVYVRAANGEMLAMIFLPLVITGAYHVFAGNRKKWWLLPLALSGVLHSHVLSCIMVLFLVLAIFIGFILNIIKEKRYKEIIFSVIAFFIVNFWYIVPFIRFYKLPLNTDNLINEYVSKDVAFIADVFTANPNTTFEDHKYFLKTLGVTGLAIICLVALFTAYMLKNKDRFKNNSYKLFVSLFACYFVTLFLSSNLMPLDMIEAKYPVLWSGIEILQFPYRLLTVVGVCGVFMLPMILKAVFENETYKKFFAPVCAFILALLIFDSSNLLEGYKNSAPIIAYPYTGDYDSHLPGDYLPAETDMSTFDDVNPYIEAGTITDYTKAGTHISFSYECDADTTANVPLMYYPCYVVKDEAGNKLSAFKCDNNRIGVKLPKGNHTVNIYAKYSFL